MTKITVNEYHRLYNDTIEAKDVNLNDIVHIHFCDTSATVVYSANGVVKKNKDGELYVKNGPIREDLISDIDGCYVFLTLVKAYYDRDPKE